MDEIKIIKITDKEYPKLLKKIPDAPKVLYIKGNFLPNKMSFAIVGTRRCSYYGKQIAIKIAEDLCEAGVTIVSGLAPGIDTAAHQAAVERKARTYAVLGTGIDKKSIYPKENLGLVEKIIKFGGCLISEYPPGTPGAKFTFPRRNRIISGLSLGTLVIEAKERSGALITASFAKKQNRKVFAIPGSIFALNSKGCHYLIKQGAQLVENAEDILKELDLLPGQKGIKWPKETKGSSREEILILKALEEEALYIDKITEKTKLSATVVSSNLAIMEVKNQVKNLGGSMYAL